MAGTVERFPTPEPGSVPTFRSFAEEYIQNHVVTLKTARTTRRIIDRLVRYFGDHLLTEIEPVHIERYLAWRSGTPSPKTGRTLPPSSLAKELGTLKALLGRAVLWGRIESDPAERVKRPIWLRPTAAAVRDPRRIRPHPGSSV